MLHFVQCLAQHHSDAIGMYYPAIDASFNVNAASGGATGAPQVHDNPIERAWYHTDWVADRTISCLDGLEAADDWFCWMSIPDPHHPWDPPASELGRVDWREVPLPATLTDDQVREVNARNAVECELIDEALGRVLAAVARRGWSDEVGGIFTTDHGELQGDFGLLFKGPYLVDGAHAPAPRLAPGTERARVPGGRDPTRRPRRPRPDVLGDRRVRPGAVDAGQGVA